MVLDMTTGGRALVPGLPGGSMETVQVEIVFHAVMVKDIKLKKNRRAVAGEVVVVSVDDAAYLLGSGRAKVWKPPAPTSVSEKEPELVTETVHVEDLPKAEPKENPTPKKRNRRK